MDVSRITLQVLRGYQLKLFFPNGSQAIVDMKKRVQAVRFGRLSTPGLFQTAKLADNEVVWDDGTYCLRASIDELLISMQLD